MENATKALIMAGGVLLVMMIVSLVLYAWNSYSDYYASQEELADIEDLTEFNLQFTSYDRDDVTGSELLSLINKVIDYNERFSSAGTNDQGYAPIEISVDFSRENGVKNIIYDDTTSTTGYIFSKKKYTENGEKHELSDLTNVTALESAYGQENLKNLAKSIAYIFTDSYNAEYRVDKFNSITSKKYVSDTTSDIYALYEEIANVTKETYTSMDTKIQNNFKEPTYEYYEYVQFKKAIFKTTGIEYNDTTGRVSSISFEYTGKVQ